MLISTHRNIKFIRLIRIVAMLDWSSCYPSGLVNFEGSLVLEEHVKTNPNKPYNPKPKDLKTKITIKRLLTQTQTT